MSTYEDSASERRIDRARAWLETRDAAEKVLILGANLNAGNELVAKTRGAAFGWHRLTLAQLAANMASTALTERGLASISQIGAEATVAPSSSSQDKELLLAHFEVSSFLASATGLLALISFCLLVFGRLGVGSIVAFLIAGLVVGQMRDLPQTSVQALQEFAELGVILLLFLIGLELQPSQLRTLGRDAIRFGAPQIAISVGVIGIYVWGVFATWDTAIVLGLGFTLSSTAVVVQLLKERNELHTSWGEKAFAILLAQDIAVVPFLLVVALISGGGAAGGTDTSWLWAMTRAIIVVVGIPVVGHFLLTRILAVAVKHQNEAAFACVTFLGVLAAALAAERAGLSMALGTFLLGATLSVSPFGHRIAASVEPVKSVLLALFFLSVGFSIDLETVASAWAPLLFNTLVILALKFGVVFLLAFAGGLPRPDAVRLSVALAQCGEFGFVLFSAAQAGGLMSPRLTALASVLITISMLATPFLLRLVAHWAPSARES